MVSGPSVALLLARLGSLSTVDTYAVLDSVLPGVAVALMLAVTVNVTELAEGSVTLRSIAPESLAALHVPPPDVVAQVQVWEETLAGIAFCTRAVVASGPALLTTIT